MGKIIIKKKEKRTAEHFTVDLHNKTLNNFSFFFNLFQSE